MGTVVLTVPVEPAIVVQDVQTGGLVAREINFVGSVHRQAMRVGLHIIVDGLMQTQEVVVPTVTK